MRHFERHETVLQLLCVMLSGLLLFAPILSDLRAAENAGPVISYFPIRVGRFGQPFTVRVHVQSETPIAAVTLVIEDDAKSVRGKMPKLKIDAVPVQVHAIRSAKLYAGPSLKKRVKGLVRLGEILYVSAEQNGFYRVISDIGVVGFVRTGDVNVLSTGSAYAVTLPASITSRPVLIYSIEAVDSRGVKSVTNPVTMRLLTDEEINSFIAANTRAGASGAGKPTYKKPLFWAGLALVAGGIYYFSNDKGGSDSDQAAVQVLVEWE